MADKNLGNEFTNNKKVKLIAGEVYDSMNYTKKAKSYMTQGELEGKKYGNTYSIYLTDPGEVRDGLEASPDTVTEYEVPVTLKNKNTSIELDAWNKLGDIESFTNEIAKPRARKLARSVEKEVIEDTLPKAFQIVVGSASFKTLTDMSKALDEVSMDGQKVTFIKPTVAGTIANAGLANFIPNEIQSKIYKENYLGNYANAAIIEHNLMPIVTIAGTETASVAVKNVSGIGAESATVVGYNVTGFTGAPNTPYKLEGVKIVGLDGIETDQDMYVIADANGKIPEVRIAVEGHNVNNANGWVATGTYTPSATLAVESGKYALGQCRDEQAVGFDQYKFSDLPGSENATESVGNVSVKMSTYGDGKFMTTLTRLDLPFACTLPEPRRAVVGYFKIA